MFFWRCGSKGGVKWTLNISATTEFHLLFFRQFTRGHFNFPYRLICLSRTVFSLPLPLVPRSYKEQGFCCSDFCLSIVTVSILILWYWREKRKGALSVNWSMLRRSHGPCRLPTKPPLNVSPTLHMLGFFLLHSLLSFFLLF